MYITLPAQPDVDMLTAELGEVAKASTTGHCHHSTFCLAPLRVGELVVPVGSFYALLDHVEKDVREVERAARLTGTGGIPKRL